MKTTQHNTGWSFNATVVALMCLVFGGCSTTQYTDFEAFVQHPRPKVTANDYQLAPPDVIRITSKRMRELNGHVETVRPDGKITLPLVGTLYVAGKTPEQVSMEIERLAQDFYEDADVSLRVERFNSKKIFVFGEVRIAGPYPYDGANTVLETLAIAQPTRLADPANIQILRPNKDGELVARMTVNMNDMVKKGNTKLNAVLEEGDIIYVPANALATIGLGIQQILLPIQPAAQTVQGTANIDQDLRNGYGTSTK